MTLKRGLKKRSLKRKGLNKMKKKTLKRGLKKRDLKRKTFKRGLKRNGLQILNIGSTNTTVRNNDDVRNSSIKWSGDYNGKLANIHVAVDDNGRKEDMDIKLTNDDLTHLLGYPAVEKQIDARLFDDFLGNPEQIYFRER
jgi:hypothetical protein